MTHQMIHLIAQILQITLKTINFLNHLKKLPKDVININHQLDIVMFHKQYK